MFQQRAIYYSEQLTNILAKSSFTAALSTKSLGLYGLNAKCRINCCQLKLIRIKSTLSSRVVSAGQSVQNGEKNFSTYCLNRRIICQDFHHNLLQARLPLAFPITHPMSDKQKTDDSQSDNISGDLNDVEEENPSQKSRIKKAFKDYGSIVFVFHITLALSWLGASYMLVSTGIDVVSILYKLGLTEEFIQSKMGTVATGTSTFVVAYAFYKIFAPVRIGITLSVTPFIVRYLRNAGILKKPANVVGSKPANAVRSK